MTAAKLNQDLKNALVTSGMLLPITLDGMGKGDTLKSFWVLCRLLPEQEPRWLDTVQRILLATAAIPLEEAEVILARRFVLKEGRMVFGWYVSVIANKKEFLQKACDAIVQAIREAPAYVPPVAALTKPAPIPRRHMTPGKRLPPVARPPSGGMTPRQPPANFSNSIRIVKRDLDPSSGSPIIVEEMPLPHTYRDLNVPNEKGKGAKYTTAKR